MIASPHSSPSLPFDRVVVVEGTTSRDLTADEFFALPLAQRIQLVVEHRASFLAGDVPVDSKDALARIRQARVRLH